MRFNFVENDLNLTRYSRKTVRLLLFIFMNNNWLSFPFFSIFAAEAAAPNFLKCA
jgi:hypothetical protein